MQRKVASSEKESFNFGNKTWEVENDFRKALTDWFSTITFKYSITTGLIDPDVGFQPYIPDKTKPEVEPFWNFTETVKVRIRGTYEDEEVSIYRKNEGTVLTKGSNGKDVPEIEPLSLPLYVIEKLVKEAVKIDAKNRFQKSTRLEPA